MKIHTGLIIISALLPVMAGCATATDLGNVERQLSTINAEIREVKGNLDEINFALKAQDKRGQEMQTKVEAIQKRQADDYASLSKDVDVIKGNQADIQNKLSAMVGGEVAGLGGQMDELKHEVSAEGARLDDLKAALMQRLAEIAEAQRAAQSAPAAGAAQTPEPLKGHSVVVAPTTAKPAPALPVGDPTRMYQSAYLDYTKGNYDIALIEFREYLKQFPDGEFSGNAQYWVGESLYSLGKYDEALAEFDKVINNYPKSAKAPGAMLKKGFCYDSLKKEKEARAAFEELIKKYPGSEAAKLAEERLKKK